jgi:mRNA capping enzyme, catalytic domain
MGQFSRGPSDFFPANWPVSICLDNMQLLEQPYIVAPRVAGTRYLLYIDRLGDIYMENSTQQIFQVDERYMVNFPLSGRSALKDTVLDGIFTQKIRPDDQSSRFGFVVHDSFRCNGVDLAARGIEERLSCIQVDEIFRSYVPSSGVNVNFKSFKFLNGSDGSDKVTQRGPETEGI